MYIKILEIKIYKNKPILKNALASLFELYCYLHLQQLVCTYVCIQYLQITSLFSLYCLYAFNLYYLLFYKIVFFDI